MKITFHKRQSCDTEGEGLVFRINIPGLEVYPVSDEKFLFCLNSIQKWRNDSEPVALSTIMETDCRTVEELWIISESGKNYVIAVATNACIPRKIDKLWRQWGMSIKLKKKNRISEWLLGIPGKLYTPYHRYWRTHEEEGGRKKSQKYIGNNSFFFPCSIERRIANVNSS